MKDKIQARNVSMFIGIIMVCLSFLVCGIIINKESAQSQSAYAIEEGGSIYIKSGATYTMNGGSIKNKSAEKGGIIYVASGATFIMNGGTLSGGTASYGGAIYVAEGGKCYLNSGTITNCSSTVAGNAVYIEDGGYLEMGESFVISGSGADYSASIKPVNPANVKRPITVTPYVNGVAKTAISTYSNVALNSIGLPNQTGCGWYEEVDYNNKVSTSDLVGNYAETNKLNLYFPSHTYGSWETTVVATCTATGLQNKTCTICSDVQSQIIQKDGTNHGTWGTYNSTIKYATCLNTGTMGTYCKGCNVLKGSSTIAINSDNHEKTTTHNSTITAATCTETGTLGTYYDCCNALKTSSVIQALGHTYGNWTTTTTATCYRAEVQTRTCSRDSSHKETKTLSVADHIYNDYISTTSPTCVAQGYDKYECQWCTKYVYTNYTAAEGHNWQNTSYNTGVNCVTQGSTNQTCSKCSATQTIAGGGYYGGHSYTSKVTTEATCIAKGVKTYTCAHSSSHNYTEEIAINSSNHTKSSTTTYGNGYTSCTTTGFIKNYYPCCNALISNSSYSSHEQGSYYTNDATCTYKGYNYYYCSRKSDGCTGETSTARTSYDTSYHYQSVGGAAWGTYTSTITAATCTATGTMGIYCSGCNAQKSTSTIDIDSTNHNWGSWVTTTSPTCRVQEVQTRTCTRSSSHTETKTLSTVDHNYNDYISTTAPTCTEQGYDKYECQWCYDYVYKNYTAIDNTNHNWGSWTTTTTPTCKRAEVQTRTCTRSSSHTQTQTLSTVDHVYNDYKSTTAPTCTAQGYDKYECQWCYDFVYKNYTAIDSTNHDWGSWATTTTATCQTAEVQTRTCTRSSSHKETQTLSKVDHNYNNYVSTTAPTCKAQGYDTYECQWCTDYTYKNYTAKDSTNHDSWGNWVTTTTPTCKRAEVQTKTCSGCSATKTQTLSSVDHNYNYYITTTLPTCKQQGYDTYECAWCTDRTNKNYKAIDSSNHEQLSTTTYGNGYTSCTTTGFIKNYYPCCGAVISNSRYTAHAQGTYRSNDATCTYKGYDYYYCSRKGNGCTAQVSKARTSYDTSYHYQSLGGAEWGTTTITDTPATCVSTGTTKTTCNGCGATRSTSTLPKDSSNHTNLSTSEGLSTNCTSNGYISTYCYGCNTTVSNSSYSSHSYGYWKVFKAATCTTSGTRRYYCNRSGCTSYSKSETIAAGHNYTIYVSESKHRCSRCSVTAAHVYLIDDAGRSVCGLCGYVSNNMIMFAPSTNYNVGDCVDCITNKYYPLDNVFVKKETAFIKEEDVVSDEVDLVLEQQKLILIKQDDELPEETKVVKTV